MLLLLRQQVSTWLGWNEHAQQRNESSLWKFETEKNLKDKKGKRLSQILVSLLHFKTLFLYFFFSLLSLSLSPPSPRSPSHIFLRCLTMPSFLNFFILSISLHHPLTSRPIPLCLRISFLQLMSPPLRQSISLISSSRSSIFPSQSFFLPSLVSLNPGPTPIHLFFSRPLHFYTFIPSLHGSYLSNPYCFLSLTKGRAFPNLCPWTAAPARACHRDWATVTHTHGPWRTEGPALPDPRTGTAACLLWARTICLSLAFTQTSAFKLNHRYGKINFSFSSICEMQRRRSKCHIFTLESITWLYKTKAQSDITSSVGFSWSQEAQLNSTLFQVCFCFTHDIYFFSTALPLESPAPCRWGETCLLLLTRYSRLTCEVLL